MLAAATAAAALALLGRDLPADGPDGSSATFNREVVRILERRCLSCHGVGARIPLQRYQDARPWALAIREEVLERRMPPWPVAHGVRPLINDLNLTAREIETFVSWADNGVRRGNPSDLPSPLPRPAWPAGPPSRIVSIPLSGGAGRQRVAIESVSGSVRVRGFDLKTSTPGLVRAAFLYSQDKDGRERWLGAWNPWHAMTSAPVDAAGSSVSGRSLFLELHIEGNARGVADVGFYFARKAPPSTLESVSVRAARNGQARARGRLVLENDLTIWALNPWRTPIDGSLEVSAVRPDGAVEPLLFVLDQGAAWPAPYVLEEPVRLTRGSALVVTAYPKTGDTAQVEVLGFSGPQRPRP